MRKRIGTILLAVALTVSCFACSKQPEQAAPVGMIDTINDYESVVEFDTMLIEGQLGKIETNDDATYIKSGKQSAKITVDAQPFISGAPKMYQSFTQEKSGNYYDDFGYTSRLRLQVYNANAGNRTLQMELICTGGGRRSAFFTLREGWNDVVYEIKREYLPMYSDPETLKSSLAVRGVNFGFERPARDEGNDVYYFDDFIRQRTKKAFAPVSMQLERDEIASFDPDWQTGLAKTTGFWRDNFSGRVSRATDGTRTYARIECPSGEDGGISWGNWALNDEQTALVPWSAYRPQSRLLFDYCVPETNPMDNVHFCLNNVTHDQDGNVKESVIFEKAIEFTEKGVWKTFSASVAEINAYIDYRKNGKTFADVTRVQFAWPEFGGNARVFYIDNIRMVY